MKVSGAKILIEVLKKHNVDTVFGYPGGSIINVYDELYKERKHIKHILTSSEQGACHSADGYARASGKVGVVFSTSGPGATNLTTAIAAAYLDSSPLVIFTGNLPRNEIGKDAFQEVDIQGVTMPITKHNYIVTDIENLENIIIEAFYLAKCGRPGPILIDLPKDIQEQKTFYKNILPLTVAYNKPENLSEAITLIKKSKYPLILAGGGIISSNAYEELALLNEKLKAPVSATMMGLTAYDNYNEFFIGMMGAYNFNASNSILKQCDLIIALGVRFSNKTLPDKKIISGKIILQIDVDPSEIDKTLNSHLSIIGDLKEVLNLLNNRIDFFKEPWFKRSEEPATDFLPKQIFDKINKAVPKNTVLVTDVGKHQLWTTQYYKFKYPRTLITSGGLGAMGFGMGGAIGSCLFNKTTILITGDGSFLMNLNELSTLKRYKLKVIVIVFNNKSLGLVKQWQNLYFKRRYAYTDIKNKIDFAKIARGFYCDGYKVKEIGEFDKAFNSALNSKNSAVIDVNIDSDLSVSIGHDIENDISDIILRG